MSVTDLNAVVTLDGVSRPFVSIQRQARFCNPGQQATIQLDPSLSAAVYQNIAPWQSVTLTEQGTLVFTGYVESVEYGRTPGAAITLIARDTWKRASDWFIHESLVPEDETVAYWVDYLCNLCGLAYEIVDNTNAGFTMGNVELGLRTVADALMSVCAYALWQMRVKPDGVLQFFVVDGAGEPDYVLEGSTLSGSLRVSDEDVRNVAKIWGYRNTGPLNVSFRRDVPGIVPDRNMVFAHTSIRTLAQATQLANAALDQFASLNREGEAVITGNPAVQVGDIAAILLGSEFLTDFITDLTSEFNAGGYSQSVRIGRRCPRLPSFLNRRRYGSLELQYIVTTTKVARTRNFLSASPNYEDITPAGLSGTIADFILDPWDDLMGAWLVTYGDAAATIYYTANLDDDLPDWIELYTAADFEADTGWTMDSGASGFYRVHGNITRSRMFVVRAEARVSGTPRDIIGVTPDGGLTWDWVETYPELSGNEWNPGSMDVSDHNDDFICFGTMSGGWPNIHARFLYSLDGGENFSNVVVSIFDPDLGGAGDVHIPYQNNPNDSVIFASEVPAGATAALLAKSTDRGLSWTDITPSGAFQSAIPQFHTYTQNRNIVAVIGSNNTDNGSRFYVATDGAASAASWSLIGQFGSGNFYRALGGWPYDPDRFMILRQSNPGGATTGHILTSEDGGANWLDKTGDYLTEVGAWTPGVMIVPVWTI